MAENEIWWAAVLDGDIEGADLRKTRREALADAKWLRGHPAVRDRQLFNRAGQVRVMRVVESEWTGEMVEYGTPVYNHS